MLMSPSNVIPSVEGKVRVAECAEHVPNQSLGIQVILREICPSPYLPLQVICWLGSKYLSPIYREIILRPLFLHGIVFLEKRLYSKVSAKAGEKE